MYVSSRCSTLNLRYFLEAVTCEVKVHRCDSGSRILGVKIRSEAAFKSAKNNRVVEVKLMLQPLENKAPCSEPSSYLRVSCCGSDWWRQRLKTIKVAPVFTLWLLFFFFLFLHGGDTALPTTSKLSHQCHRGEQSGTIVNCICTLMAVNGLDVAGNPHIPANCCNAQEDNCQFDGVLSLSNWSWANWKKRLVLKKKKRRGGEIASVDLCGRRQMNAGRVAANLNHLSWLGVSLMLHIVRFIKGAATHVVQYKHKEEEPSVSC